MGDKPCDDSDETPPSLIAAEDAHGHDDQDHDHEQRGEGHYKDGGETEATAQRRAATENSDTSRDFGDQLVASSSSAGTTNSCCSSPASGGGGRVDAFLRKFVTFSSSTANADRGIKLVQYLCWLGSRLTTAPPGDPSKSGGGGANANPLLLLLLLGNSERLTEFGPDVSPGLRKIYFDLSMARYVLRLYGLPQSLEAARNDTWCGAGGSRIQWLLGRIMAWSMVAYYPLEHVAWGAWVAPKLIRADAEKYTAWSCRFWAAYIGADLASTVLRLRDLARRRRELLLTMGGDDGGSKDDGPAGERVGGEELRLRHKQQSEEIRQKIRHDALHAARCVLFALPAIHWSRRDWERRPWLRENVLNGLMLAESVTCLIQSICSLS